MPMAASSNANSPFPPKPAPIAPIPLAPLSERPLVSIIVPSYNQGQFIGETLESILSQSYRPLEVLVIDGASTDGTVDVLKSLHGAPELRWWSEPDRGVVEAVNKGFAKARGGIVGIQSSDDCYEHGAIAIAVEQFRRDPQLGLVYGDTVKVDTEGKELFRTRTASFTLENLLSKRTWIPQCSAFFRLDLAKRLGGWDESYFNADTELWLRMAFRTKMLKVDRLLSRRTMHAGQRDERGEEILASYWRMIEQSPDLKNAPRRLRRAAECGKYLHAIRYRPSASRWAKGYCAWRAVLAYPKILGRADLAPLLFPGYRPLRNALGRLRRRFVA